MNLTELAAVVGAAAWIPQILRYFSKAEVKIIPGATVEIGYSFFGPIINPTCAFSASKKDALIERMTIKLIHQNGETHEFLWQAINEKGYETRSSKGETIETRRSQVVTALKIGTLGLMDRMILFQDTTIKAKRLDLETELLEKAYLLEKNDIANFPDNVFKSDEYARLSEHQSNSFFWKEGDYNFEIIAQEATQRKPFIENYTFSLSNSDKNSLEKNIPIAQEYYKVIILHRAGKIPTIPELPWNWLYPTITKSNKK
ncbi:MAG: hypothetical protein ACYDH0_11030 [Candidatus Aminicenantales bacterium]